MHEARRQKAREIEERKARARAGQDRASAPMIIAGAVGVALVVFVAIKLAGILL